MFGTRISEQRKAMCCRMLFSRAEYVTGAFDGMFMRLREMPLR